MGMLRRTAGKSPYARMVIGMGLVLYGAYSAWPHQIWQYLFLRTEFVWMDPAWSGLHFFLDHLAMMGLFALLTHCAVTFLRWRGRKEAERI